MNRTRKSAKILALAAGSVLGFNLANRTAPAGTITWLSTTNQSWELGGNWGGGFEPGSSDTAYFSSAALPPGGTANFSTNWSGGAIVYNDGTPTSNLAFAGTATLTLSGQTVTVPEPAGFGASTFKQANTILANTSTLTTSQTMKLGSGLNLVLNNGANYIITSQGSGGGSGQGITINGNISNGSGTSSLTYLGGGNGSANGGTLTLAGTDTFSGGMTIGTPDGTQGGLVAVNAAQNLPSSGSIVVNDQSQLAFNTQGTYGQPGQLLVLNGIGINKNISGALRTGGSANNLFVWQGDLSLGSSLPADGTGGQVIISVTSVPSKIFQITGKFTGTGSLQKQGSGLLQFSGTNDDNSGGTQIGNGVITVDAGSQMGTGDLFMMQTATNTTTVNLFNTQNVGNLLSGFTATSGGTPTADIQAINIGTIGLGTSVNGLVIHQHSNTSFGYGADVSLTSTLQGSGTVMLDKSSTGALTLTGPNTYTGNTLIAGGTLNIANGTHLGPLGEGATGTGTVTVGDGTSAFIGHLASGNTTVLGATVNSGSITGNLVVNNNGVVAPGNDFNIGTIGISGNLYAKTGSAFSFDLIGGTSAQADRVIVNGAATLDSGTETIDVIGSKLAFGTYTLMNFGTTTGGNAGAGGTFVLGTVPGSTTDFGTTSVAFGNRTYQLMTGTGSLQLVITPTGVEREWSVGGFNPAVDGAGTWTVGGTNWFNTPGTTQAPYDNSSSADVIMGNAGTAGLVTLGSNIRVGGVLNFSTVRGTSSYTIGTSSGTNTLTLAKGIVATSNATVNAPIILEAPQTFSASTGASLVINGGISGTGSLTKDDVGTVILNGTGTYTGGTSVVNGALVTTTAGIPVAGGVANNSMLVFQQGNSGTYAGLISGSGSVIVNNSSPTASLVLGSNSYTGATVVQGGVLKVGAENQLGTGDGGIALSGGTLQATAPLNFPRNAGGNTPVRNVTLTASTTSTIDTNGFNVTLNQNISGAGNLNKIGTGSLTLTGWVSTTIIGQVAVGAGGALVLAPPANIPSFGLSADSVATNTFGGDLVVDQPMELRLYGGNFSGGGHIVVDISGINIVSRGATTIGNQIVLNPSSTPGFSVNLGANTGNSITYLGGISGNSDVLFTNGAGFTSVGGTNTYTGNTTIDNGNGGEVMLLSDNTLPTGTGVHVSSTGIFDLNGHQQTIASLDAGNDTATVVNGTGSINTPSVLTIVGSGSTQFNGIIIDGNASAMGLRLGAGNTGNLTLNGTNTYTGGTTLNGGTLTVGQDLNISNPGAPITFGGGALATTASFDFSDRPVTINPGSSTISVGSGNTLRLLGTSTTTWAGGSLTVTGGGTFVMARSGGAKVSVANGSTLGIDTNTTVQVTTPFDSFTDGTVSTRHLAVVNNGTLLLPTGNSVIASHTGSGALSITNGATLKVASGAVSVTNRAGTLTIDMANNSRLDLTSNSMILDSTPLATVKSMIISGYNSGAWNGPGIISSTAAPTGSPRTALGYAQAGALGISTFGGQNVNPTSVLVKYTYAGDSNLDGQVDARDLSNLAAHWLQPGDWSQGDFNYDGQVNILDLYSLALDWQRGVGSPLALPADLGVSPSFAAALFSVNKAIGASVPEPATVASMLTLCGGMFLKRRRRTCR